MQADLHQHTFKRHVVRRLRFVAAMLVALSVWVTLGQGYVLLGLVVVAVVSAVCWPSGDWRLPLVAGCFGFALSVAGYVDSPDLRNTWLWLGLVAGASSALLWSEERWDRSAARRTAEDVDPSAAFPKGGTAAVDRTGTTGPAGAVSLVVQAVSVLVLMTLRQVVVSRPQRSTGCADAAEPPAVR